MPSMPGTDTFDAEQPTQGSALDEELTARATTVCAALARRVQFRDLQLRRSFVRGSSGAPSPMGRVLRGGRGGHVRLKLFLTLNWIAVGGEHTISIPARTWADALGLPDPKGRGARRVRDAEKWLVNNDLLAYSGPAGTFQLLDEGGTGAAYSPPGRELSRLKEQGLPYDQHIYLKVPVSTWTNGWMAALDGPAVAVLLILLDQRADHREAWIAPNHLRDWYGVSEDTRSRGTKALREFGLVRTRRRPVSPTDVDRTRTRVTYLLDLERFSDFRPGSHGSSLPGPSDV
jgi:hypothetical protein